MATSPLKRFSSLRLPMIIRLTRSPLSEHTPKKGVDQNPLLVEILEILQVMNERIEEQDSRIDVGKGSVAYHIINDKIAQTENAKHVYKIQQETEASNWDCTNEYARSILRLKALVDNEEQPPLPAEPRDVDLYSLSNYSQAERRASQSNLVQNVGRWVEPTPPVSESQTVQNRHSIIASSFAADESERRYKIEPLRIHAQTATEWSFSDTDENDPTNSPETLGTTVDDEFERISKEKGKSSVEHATKDISEIEHSPVPVAAAQSRRSFSNISKSSTRSSTSTRQALPARPLAERISNPHAEVSFHAYSSWKIGIVDRIRSILPGKGWNRGLSSSLNHSVSVGTDADQRRSVGTFAQIRDVVGGFGRFEMNVVRIVC